MDNLEFLLESNIDLLDVVEEIDLLSINEMAIKSTESVKKIYLSI